LSGEGKTTIAANLAIAFAQSGASVIAVDADLRRARLSATFGLSDAAGLSSVLTRQADLGDSLVSIGPNLWLLPAGPLPPNPAELIGSQAMARLMTGLDEGAEADVVIVDVPPILPVTDAVALATQVQSVVMVLRAGRTRRDVAQEAARRLEVVGADLVGCVLNGVPRSGAARYQRDYRYAAPDRGGFRKERR
jgi:capsular exopolysaccharide synthesis family protein